MSALTLSRLIKLAGWSLELSIFTDRFFSVLELVSSSFSKLTDAHSIRLSPSFLVLIALKPVVHTYWQKSQDSSNAKASKGLHFLAGCTRLALNRNLNNF